MHDFARSWQVSSRTHAVHRLHPPSPHQDRPPVMSSGALQGVIAPCLGLSAHQPQGLRAASASPWIPK
eukprot:7857600-Alexandrium_andersonii.AAC.1